MQFDTVRDIKEKLCYITTAHGTPPGEDEYELPDGSTVTLDSECRSQAAEVCGVHVPSIGWVYLGGVSYASMASEWWFEKTNLCCLPHHLAF